MATLYELDAMYKNFEPEIDYETGEVLNAEEWEQLELDLNTKIENTAIKYLELIAEAEQHKEQKEKQAEWEKQAKTKAEWLKSRLDDVLKGEKFSTDRIRISFRKSESVSIDDPTLLDHKWYVEQQPRIDKAGIKQAIKSGEVIAGASLIENNNIQIK